MKGSNKKKLGFNPKSTGLSIVKLKPISLKLDLSLMERIRVVAHNHGLSYKAMIRYLLSKGIEREIREH